MRLHTINTKTFTYTNMEVVSSAQSFPIHGFCYLNGNYYIARGVSDSIGNVWGCSIQKVDGVSLLPLQINTLFYKGTAPSSGEPHFIPLDIITDGNYIYMYTRDVTTGKILVRKFTQDLQQVAATEIKLLAKTGTTDAFASTRGFYKNGFIYMGTRRNANISKYEIATGEEKIISTFDVPDSGYIDFDPSGNMYCIGATRSYASGFVVFSMVQKTDKKMVYPTTIHGVGGNTSCEQFCFFDSKYVYIVDDDLSFSGATLVIGPNKKLLRYTLNNNIIGDSP
jgi:hypothetical protein